MPLARGVDALLFEGGSENTVKLAEKRQQLHMLPASPHPVAFGLTRTIGARPPMVTFDSGQYAVPHTPLGQTVCVRANGVNDRSGGGEQIVIVHLGPVGPVEDAPTGGRGQSAASCEPT